ncbi:MAG: hypothetical protein FJ225_04130 [Lentisphaerae bacterium]|nr:hypothetical protein [Lentisphaerota bacterium]
MKRGSVGPEGKFNAGRFVEGRFGQGIELNMQEQFGVTFPVGIVPTSAGCIEFWAKLADLPEAMPWGQKPGLIGVNDRDEGNRGSILHFNGNDGASNGGLRAGLGGIGSAGTARIRPKMCDPARQTAQAGRMVLTRIAELVRRRFDFAMETTLSGRTYVRMFRSMRERGYRLNMYFVWLPSPELALLRIEDRVRHGGHDVPSRDVRRRFDRSIHNLFREYLCLMDSVSFSTTQAWSRNPSGLCRLAFEPASIPRRRLS